MRRSPFPPVEPSEYAVGKNDQVRAELAHLGDDGSTPRLVAHYFKVGRDEVEADLAAGLKVTLLSHGFAVEISSSRDLMIASETREIASSDFDSLTQALCELARRHASAYDGFECAVEAGDGSSGQDWRPLKALRRLARRGP